MKSAAAQTSSAAINVFINSTRSTGSSLSPWEQALSR